MRSNKHFKGLFAIIFSMLLSIGHGLQAQETDSTISFFFVEGEEEQEKEKTPFKLQFRQPNFKGALSIFRYLPDENSESSINFGLGAEVEWNVYERLYLGTGLHTFFINQNFPVGDERVRGRLANGALLAREHVSTDLSITGIEIPVIVRYNLSDEPGSLFISMTLSSRTSLKEKYTDHIDWKMGGTSGGNFIASSTRSTVIRNESPQSFEFFNLFHTISFGIGKSIHVYGAERGEIMIGYTLNLYDMQNIFQEARYKKFEALGLSIKFPLPIGRQN